MSVIIQPTTTAPTLTPSSSSNGTWTTTSTASRPVSVRDRVERLAGAFALRHTGQIVWHDPAAGGPYMASVPHVGDLASGLGVAGMRQLADQIERRWPHGHLQGHHLPAPYTDGHITAEIWYRFVPNPAATLINQTSTSTPAGRTEPVLLVRAGDVTFAGAVTLAQAPAVLADAVDLVTERGALALAVLATCHGQDTAAALIAARAALD